MSLVQQHGACINNLLEEAFSEESTRAEQDRTTASSKGKTLGDIECEFESKMGYDSRLDWSSRTQDARRTSTVHRFLNNISLASTNFS